MIKDKTNCFKKIFATLVGNVKMPKTAEKSGHIRPKYGSNFDWLFLKRSYNLLKLLFPGVCSLTTVLFLLLLSVALLEQYLIYNVGLISSKYYSVLGSRDYNGFLLVTRNSVLFILAVAFTLSTKNYVCNVLYISWRQLLCRAIHRQYFKRINFYHLNVLDDLIDNPDQRITQDVDKLCQTWSQIIAVIIISPFTIGYYTYSAYTSTSYVGPTGVFLFFIIGTIANKLLMSPVVKRVVRQEKLEGNFRFKHMQIRSNAETIAFFGGGAIESVKTNEKLQELIDIQMKLANRQYPLNMSTNIFDYLGSIISYLVIAVPIFTGKYDSLSSVALSSIISETSFVCMYLMNCFSQLVDLSTKVTDIAGTTHRVAQLIEELVQLPVNSQGHEDDEKDEPEKPLELSPTTGSDRGELPKDTFFSLKKISFVAPRSSSNLVKDLSLVVRRNNNILVTGSSSNGKSSLLRVLKGLWPIQKGKLKCSLRETPSEILYLPQKPYFTNGTLRQQIVYPLEDCGAEEDEMFRDEDAAVIKMLNIAELQSLLDRTGGLDAEVTWNWFDVLSPGEMQRLSFVRLFYHRPKIALLDEATSAVGLDLEIVLYEECQRLGITLVSVGHRESLRIFHDQFVHLAGKGDWTTGSLKDHRLSGSSQAGASGDW